MAMVATQMCCDVTLYIHCQSSTVVYFFVISSNIIPLHIQCLALKKQSRFEFLGYIFGSSLPISNYRYIK